MSFSSFFCVSFESVYFLFLVSFEVTDAAAAIDALCQSELC